MARSPAPSVGSDARVDMPVPSDPRHVHFGFDETYSLEADEDESGGREMCMSLNASRGRVGCAYYDGGKVFLMEDTQDSLGWDTVVTILEQVQPSMVLTSAAADPGFLAVLQSTLEYLPSVSSSTSLAGTEDPSAVRLEYRPARDFYAGQGRIALSGLRIVEGIDYRDGVGDGGGAAFDSTSYCGRRRGDDFNDRSRRNEELRLGSFLSGLDTSPLTLGCAGSLIGHISRSLSANGELDVEANFVVQGLELLSLDKVMLINHDALVSLQIFESESHASVHSDKTKEGLSLFGIMNLTRTPLGNALMKQWFLRPSLELSVIKSRHDATECFLRNENQHVIESVQTNFRSIKNAPKTLKILQSGRGGAREWQAAWTFLYGSVMIRDALLSLTSRRGVGIVDKLLEYVDASAFQDLGNVMNDVIDWEESTLATGRMCVKTGVNEELDELRRKYHGISSFLSGVAVDISRSIQTDIARTLSVVYFPQIGYLIVIPTPVNVSAPDDLEIEGWDYQFQTEELTYYKNDKCRDLDRHLGDIHSFIADKEIEILHALLTTLLEHESRIISTCDALAELDCLIAFTEAARIYAWNRPTMTEANIFRIHGGRHPLVEIVVDSYVKSDSSLLGGRGVGWEEGLDEDERSRYLMPVEDGCLNPNHSMIIVTGANYSGKSIFLKQTALLTYMAHLGSFIPAEFSLIGLTDKILTRVATRESVSRGSSAFMIDLQQISFALRNVTARSLLIIDEFGKGTESADGAGLFCGVMEHLVNRGINCPKVAVATHFQDVIASGLLSRDLPIGFAHMEIMLHQSTTVVSPSQDEVTYLYQLVPGLSTGSHATSCAALYGIPSPLLLRAEQITKQINTFEIYQILHEEISNLERKDLARSEEITRNFLKWEIGEEGIEELLGRLKEMLD